MDIIPNLVGRLTRIQCKDDEAQTYFCYLPQAYRADKRWPIIYCFSPVGDGEWYARHYREVCEKTGWIIAASNNARNGSMAANTYAMVTIWKNTHDSFNILEERCYAMGYSGGAAMALRTASTFPIAGTITIAAGSPWKVPPQRTSMFLLCGEQDGAVTALQNFVKSEKTKGRSIELRTFQGTHQIWPPSDLLQTSVLWMENIWTAQKGGIGED